MRVLFCTTGGAGHVLPLRPLAQALRAGGHAVAWVTAPDALPWLDGLGLDRFAAGPSFEVSRHQFRETFPDVTRLAGEALSAFTFPRLFGAVLAPAMLEALDQAVERWRPDCVVHEPAALAAALVCRQRDLRRVAHGYGLRPDPDALASALAWFAPHWHARGLEVPIDGGLSRQLYLDIVPATLQPPAPAARHEFRFNPYRPAAAGAAPALPAGLEAALRGPDALSPRIYLSFGTVFNRSPVLIAAAQAAARLGGTLVVSGGSVDAGLAALAGLPGRVHVLRFVDQLAVLGSCDAVVSHGGAGTVLGAAAHGLPQLILPQAADHFRNARALNMAGAGLSLQPAQQTVELIAASLGRLLASDMNAAHARRLAQEMAAMPDAAAAARWLEQRPWRAAA